MRRASAPAKTRQAAVPTPSFFDTFTVFWGPSTLLLQLVARTGVRGVTAIKMEKQAPIRSQVAGHAWPQPSDDPSGQSSRIQRPAPARLLWLILVAAALALAVCSYDQPITDRVVAARKSIETVLGPPAALATFLIFPAILFSFANRRRLLIGFFSTVLLSGLITQTLKRVVGRARPDEHLGSVQFDLSKSLPSQDIWLGMGQYHSFPSGDAMLALVLALLLGIYFPRARLVFYICAGFVGLQRIVLERHFASDVLAGYAVAAASVYICLRLLGPTYYDRDLPESTCSLSPSEGGRE